MQFTELHCINPDCSRPFPQSGGNQFCQSCGTPLCVARRYWALQKLGTGGFAIAYLAHDSRDDRQCVLKVLTETQPKAVELFEQEARVLMNLRHPGVPRVEADGYFLLHLNFPQARSLPCLVMEKIEGETLQHLLDRHPQGFSESQVVDWLNQTLDILEELHRHRIIHRDLKPANLMVRATSGQIVAIDFGGAKHLGAVQGSSTRLFSPGYSPPEQIAGGSVGPTADFYALGRTCVHLLTGKPPGEFDDPMTLECRWRQAVAVSPVLGAAIDRAIAGRPEERPADVAEFRAILGNLSGIQTLVRQRKPSLGAIAWKQTAIALQVVGTALKRGGGAIARVTRFAGGAIAAVVQTSLSVLGWSWRACWDTLMGMLLGGLGASIGASVGFGLTYGSRVGLRLSDRLSGAIAQWFPGAEVAIDPVVLLFAFAGLGTALGLTEAGSFGQHRRFIIAGAMGIFGYSCGALTLNRSLFGEAIAVPELVIFSAIAIASVALGLGLPRYQLFHATVSAIGTATLLMVGLYAFSAPAWFPFLTLTTAPGWPEFWESLVFFSLLGILGSFCLGVSYYLLVPLLRLLGWR
ncbi:serine/threonine protein kinase [Oxynema sp. CENA135]|uniref:serine/threonine protein kinase n=1 Tax=Oxynema sp. CENA135 TaxID=984206 RepID=UPI00190D2DFF|nr:serine/threonine-protein kinase [Oxynema sp. CENA135]MBK4729143.1 serine/threonine protein kinase [Oxynema sp. CENA135]